MQNKKDELQSAVLALKHRAAEIERFLDEGELDKAQELLDEVWHSGTRGAPTHEHVTRSTVVPEGSRTIEGVFDGQYMVGADGKQYLVPSNYASKSKLVEGDLMKLAITHEGAFIYKQIAPIERRRIVGKLEQDEHSFWHATDGVHSWRIITASVTYFKGKIGDEAVVFVPAKSPSKWAAVENIIAR